MGRAMWLALVLSVSIIGAGHAQDGQAIAGNLDKAKKDFEGKEEAFRTDVAKRLDALEKSATKNGKKALLDQVTAEREAFEQDGALPKCIRMSDLLTKKESARRSMVITHKKAISEYTKNEMRNEAEVVEFELIEFEATHNADAPNIIRTGAVWMGAHKEDWADGKQFTHDVKFKITEQDGKTSGENTGSSMAGLDWRSKGLSNLKELSNSFLSKL